MSFLGMDFIVENQVPLAEKSDAATQANDTEYGIEKDITMQLNQLARDRNRPNVRLDTIYQDILAFGDYCDIKRIEGDLRILFVAHCMEQRLGKSIIDFYKDYKKIGVNRTWDDIKVSLVRAITSKTQEGFKKDFKELQVRHNLAYKFDELFCFMASIVHSDKITGETGARSLTDLELRGDINIVKHYLNKVPKPVKHVINDIIIQYDLESTRKDVEVPITLKDIITSLRVTLDITPDTIYSDVRNYKTGGYILEEDVVKNEIARGRFEAKRGRGYSYNHGFGNHGNGHGRGRGRGSYNPNDNLKVGHNPDSNNSNKLPYGRGSGNQFGRYHPSNHNTGYDRNQLTKHCWRCNGPK